MRTTKGKEKSHLDVKALVLMKAAVIEGAEVKAAIAKTLVILTTQTAK